MTLLPDRVFNVRIKLRNDSHANWEKQSNFVPMDGEIIIYDKDSEHPYQLLKIGDGVSSLNHLPFINSVSEVEINRNLEEEISLRQEADTNLQNIINTESINRQEEDGKIHDKLDSLNPIAYDGNVNNLTQNEDSEIILDCNKK